MHPITGSDGAGCELTRPNQYAMPRSFVFLDVHILGVKSRVMFTHHFMLATDLTIHLYVFLLIFHKREVLNLSIRFLILFKVMLDYRTRNDSIGKQVV